MLSFDIPAAQVQSFLLVFFRMIGMIMVLPVFGSKNLPIILKAGFAFTISFVVFPAIRLDSVPAFSELLPFAFAIGGEAILGLMIGFAVQLIFAGLQLAGEIASFQMGLSIVNVIDPQTSSTISIMAQFYNLLAMLILFAINAHHWLLKAAVESYALVPPLVFNFTGSAMGQLIRLSQDMLIISIKVAAPIMVVLVVASIALGLVARTVPQLNVFMVSLPLNIAVGLIVLGFSLPLLFDFFSRIFDDLGKTLFLLLKAV